MEIKLLVEPHESVEDVKRKIQDAEGTPSAQQRLFLAGRLVLTEETSKFSELRFPRGCRLYLNLHVLPLKASAGVHPDNALS